MKDIILSVLTPEVLLVAGTAFSGFLLSVSVSFWTDYVRRLGDKATPAQLSLTYALNYVAGNPHKAKRYRKVPK